jgi:hypothetical protein
MAKGYGREIHLNTGVGPEGKYPVPSCGGKLNPVVRYRRGTRKDGTTYLGRFVSGDPCPNPATSTLPGTPTKHRCTAHRSQS